MTEWMKPGVRCQATDAAGDTHHGEITYGPARDRHEIRGDFVKVWIRFDGRDDEIPWPVEDVHPEDGGRDR